MKTIVRNGGWNSFASLVAMVLGTLCSVLVVRQLTSVEYGSYSYLLWLFGIIGILGTLGFPNGLTKLGSELIGEGRAEDADALFLRVAVGLAGVNLLLSLVFTWVASVRGLGGAYLLIAALLIPNALATALRSRAWSEQRYRGVAIASSLGSLAQFLLVLLTYRYGWRVAGYLAAFVVSVGVQFLFLLIRYVRTRSGLRRITLSRTIPGDTSRAYLSFVAQATLVMIITIVVWERSGVYFLERYSGLTQVGYYNLAYTTFSMFLTLGWAFINGFYPALSFDFGAGRHSQLQRRMVQGLELALVASIPASFGGLALLGLLLPALYGIEMSASVLVAQVLYIGLVPGILAGMLNICLSATGHIKTLWISGLIVGGVTLGLMVALVPRGGALGAAVANTIAQLLYTGLMGTFVVRTFALRVPWRRLGALLLLGAVTCLVLPLLIITSLGPSILAIVPAILVAAIAYLLCLLALGYATIVPGGMPLRPGRWLQ